MYMYVTHTFTLDYSAAMDIHWQTCTCTYIPVHGLQDWNVSDGKETEIELHQVREKLRGERKDGWPLLNTS